VCQLLVPFSSVGRD